MAMQNEEIFADDETVEIYSQQPKTLRAHRQKRSKEPVTEKLQPTTPWYVEHLYTIGLWMIALFLLSLAFCSVVLPLYTNIVDRWSYGEARISQFDCECGHNGTSHFIAQYYQKQVVLIEFPQNHPERATVYTVHLSMNGNDTPRTVTLSAAYINLHGKKGHPDLVVQVEGLPLAAILYNTGNGFSQEQ